jgi:manganese oxidase
MTEAPRSSPLTRRQLLMRGAFGLGTVATAIAGYGRFASSSGTIGQTAAVQVPQPQSPAGAYPYDPMAVLREFDQGQVVVENGRSIRQFELTAKSMPLQLNAAVTFMTWSLNGRVPGPTLRAKAGERLRIIFHNADATSHSLHFHGIHPAAMDGISPVRRGKTFVYEFDAAPVGLHPYHCHIAPVAHHIGKGLYGLLIIDPPEPRPPADELVLVMAGYDLKRQGKNDLYAFNGIPNFYRDRPIEIYQNQLVRLYLLNLVEFDPVMTFHIHANLFQVFPTGRTLVPREETDVVSMGIAERHILEFTYADPGMYMFHPHQDEIAERGCMGHFMVRPRPA